MSELETTRFVAMDLETGGFDPKKNPILEVGAVLFEAGEIVDSLRLLVCPDEEYKDKLSVSLEAIKVNGIDIQKHLAIAVPESYAFAQCTTWMHSKRVNGKMPWVIGHNFSLDMRFLCAWSDRVGRKIFDILDPQRTTDTMHLYRYLQMCGGVPVGSAKLGVMAKSFGVAEVEEHHAVADCIMSGRSFLKIAEKLTVVVDTQASGSLNFGKMTPFSGDKEKERRPQKTLLETVEEGLEKNNDMAPEDAVALAEEIIELCDGIEEDSPGYDFAKDVGEKVQGVKEWVEEADRVTGKQETALHNWRSAIGRWYKE